MGPNDPTPATAAQYSVLKGSELRVEVGDGGVAYLRLSSGTAEVFGVELTEGRTYTFAPGRKFAVFSWYGCTVTLWGEVSHVYSSTESSVPLYANLHQRLEARRQEAKLLGLNGPRMVVVGPTDSGKSTLVRTLAAYACRVGHSPTIVDVDPGQGEISMPGTIAATPVDRSCLSVEEGFTHTQPLVYYPASASPGDSVEVYRNCLHRLADTVNRRFTPQPAPATSSSSLAPSPAALSAGVEGGRVSGVLINTMGWVDKGGYELLLDTIRGFQADVVVVVGHDKVFARLSEDCKGLKFPAAVADVQAAAAAAAATAAAQPSDGSPAAPPASQPAFSGPTKTVTVVKLTKPGGVVERSSASRKEARSGRIREYFYGASRGPGIPPALSPASIVVRFDEVTIVRVGGATSEAGILPIGKSSTLDPLRVTTLTPSPGTLTHHVLGVSYASTEKQVPHVNIAGFVHVTAVNSEAKTLTLLAPCAGPLPSRFLLAGDIKWVE